MLKLDRTEEIFFETLEEIYEEIQKLKNKRKPSLEDKFKICDLELRAGRLSLEYIKISRGEANQEEKEMPKAMGLH